jgi:hypothetical protein
MMTEKKKKITTLALEPKRETLVSSEEALPVRVIYFIVL